MQMRSRRPRTPKVPHPTAGTLLNTAIALLESTPLDEISIAMVLESSGVSHGSLYHHFHDFGNLIEQAAVSLYERGLNESIEALTAMLESRDAADFRARAEELILYVHSPERRKFRMARVEVIGLSQHRPRLAERLAKAQQHHLDAQGALFAEFQQRGWMRSDLDPMAVNIFTSGVTLGRIVDDIAERHVDQRLMNQVVLAALGAVLFPAAA
jgi:AcrR family transcriptional regulator